jgi:cytochrome P450
VADTSVSAAFNPFEPGFFADPYRQYADLRAHDPVHHSPLQVFVITRYDDVVRVLRDPSLSVDVDNALPTVRMLQAVELYGDAVRQPPRTILNLDPPDHTRLRRLVSKAFTPRSVEQLRPRIVELVDDLLDALAAATSDTADGVVDVVQHVAFPLPFAVISEMLGMPEADRDQLRTWSHTLTKTLDPVLDPADVQAVIAAGDGMAAHIADAVAWKRSHPADDLLTRLIQAEDEGDTLTEQELLDQVTLLFVAGHETTVNLIGNGLWHLLRHPAQLADLHADPGLEANAVDELLRYDSPVQFSRRIPVVDLEVGGTTVPAGTFVLTGLGAANRDPAHFGPTADELDLRRPDARDHVAFGSGVHHCLGASLARLEAAITLGRIVRRFPAIAPATDEADWNGRVVLRGLESLLVTV